MSVYLQPNEEQISEEPPNGTRVVPANNKNCLKAWNATSASLCEGAAHLPTDHLTAVASHSRVTSQEEKRRSTLDQLHIITYLLMAHYRWKPQLPGDEPGTHCLEVNEVKTTSADAFKDICTSTLQFYT